MHKDVEGGGGGATFWDIIQAIMPKTNALSERSLIGSICGWLSAFVESILLNPLWGLCVAQPLGHTVVKSPQVQGPRFIKAIYTPAVRPQSASMQYMQLWDGISSQRWLNINFGFSSDTPLREAYLGCCWSMECNNWMGSHLGPLLAAAATGCHQISVVLCLHPLCLGYGNHK